MPNCRVCDSNEFELCDGLYYCRTCNTESQELREETVEFDAPGAYSSKTSSLLVRRPVLKTPEKSIHIVTGTSVTTTELFTIVLKIQVESLISLGVNKKIKDIVFDMWAKYLQKCELAFCEEAADDNWLPRLGHRPRICDYRQFRPNSSSTSERKRKCKTEKDSTRSSKKRRSYLVNEDSDHHSDVGEEAELESLLSKADSSLGYYTDGSICESDISSVITDSSVSSSIKADRKIRKSRISKTENGSKRILISRMTIKRTLTFLCIGIYYLGDLCKHLCVSDVIRWVREGHIPYQNIMNYFPKELADRLASFERYVLFVGIDKEGIIFPSFLSMCEDVKSVMKFLVLPEVKRKTPKYLIARFIKDLNLPKAMISMCVNLMNRVRKSLQSHSSIHGQLKSTILNRYGANEKNAISCIIICLKLLFGLNDESEKQLSDHAENVTEENLNNVRLFSWKQWFEHMSIKVHFIESYHLNFKSKFPKFNDVDGLIKYIETFKQNKTNVYKAQGKRKKCCEVWNKFHYDFKSMSGSKTTLNPEPTLLPFTDYTKFYLARVTLPNNALYVDFSNYSVEYLIKTSEVKSNNNLDCYVDSDEDVSDMDTNDLSSDADSISNCLKNYLTTTHGYTYLMYHVKDPEELLPFSLWWLLKVCSLLTEVNEKDLFIHTNCLERVLIGK